MANKSSRSPTGEDREEPNVHKRDEGVQKEEILENSGKTPSKKPASQENLKNRGYEEDQPGNPIRGNGKLDN